MRRDDALLAWLASSLEDDAARSASDALTTADSAAERLRPGPLTGAFDLALESLVKGIKERRTYSALIGTSDARSLSKGAARC